MGTVGYIAIYIVTWMVCLFVVLPWGVRNQSDTGDIVAGSEPGAPATFRIWKKLAATTILAALVVALIYWGVTNPVLQRYWR
jgi:predicted secreted protein